MQTTYTILIVLHVTSGFTAFVAAPVAMAVRKGGKSHRRFGRLFFWAMTGVCATAFALSVIRPNLFLFAVSGFSYYLVASGYRWLYRKKARTWRDVAGIDWLLVILAALFNLLLAGYGVLSVRSAPHGPFGYIACVFGFLGLRLVYAHLRSFARPPQKNAWLLHHMGGMVGGYVATVSAFSAVNFDFLPTLVQWLWPTVLGVPLLTAWIGRYKRKLRAGAPVESLVETRTGGN